jgi:hypothetical protein
MTTNIDHHLVISRRLVLNGNRLLTVEKRD